MLFNLIVTGRPSLGGRVEWYFLASPDNFDRPHHWGQLRYSDTDTLTNEAWHAVPEVEFMTTIENILLSPNEVYSVVLDDPGTVWSEDNEEAF